MTSQEENSDESLQKRDIMSASSTPFDDIRALTQSIPARDEQIYSDVMAVIGPKGDDLRIIGRLNAPIAWLASWQGRRLPAIDRPLVAVFVGSHGAAAHVLGEDPAAGGAARAKLMTEGAAGVRAIASSYQTAFKVFEMGTELPCADMREEPSLSERDCAAAIAFGMEVVAEGADILALGNAGYGSATAAAAIAAALYGGQTSYWAGGSADIAPRRIAAVDAALKTHSNHLGDPLQVLARFGGRDLAGMAGAILAARHQRIPVLLDGFVVCAAAAILHSINPDALTHCFAAHATAEPAHKALLDRLGLDPIHDFQIGLGDGTGGALAIGTLKAAAAAANTLLEQV